MHRSLAFLLLTGVLGVVAWAQGETIPEPAITPQPIETEFRPVSPHADVRGHGTDRSARITTAPRFSRTGDTYRAPDLVPVRDVRSGFTHRADGISYLCRYAAAMPENGYRFERGNHYATYSPTGDWTGTTVAITPLAEGVKEDILFDETAPRIFRWRIATNARYTLDGQEVVFRDDNDRELFRTMPPVAWDAGGRLLAVTATLTDDSLAYTVTVPEDAEWPCTLDPGTTTTGMLDGYMVKSTNSYLNSRNAVTATAALALPLYVGEHQETTNYHTYRSPVSFPLDIPEAMTVTACTLYVYGYGDQSDTDFDLYLLSASSYGPTLDTGDFSTFDGWQASGVYTGTPLNDTWNSTSFVDDAWNRIVFNQAGLDSATIALEDTLRIILLSSHDYTSTSITGLATVVFDNSLAGNPPYLSMEYTPYECNTDYVKSYYPSTLRTIDAADTTHDAARSTALAANVNVHATVDTLGQYKVSAGDFRTYRMELAMPITRQANVVYACSLFITGVGDQSATEFDIEGYAGAWAASDSTGSAFFSFDGHHDSTTAYDGTNLLESFSTASFNASGEDTLVFNADGLAAVLAASQDTLRMVLASGRDYDADEPTGAEYVVFDPASARISVRWALNDSIPTDVSMSPVAADSILISWRDRCHDETGYRIIALADSAVIDSTGADAGEITIGGLVPDTVYSWMVQVIGGAYADSISVADSTRTLAAMPGIMHVFTAGGDVFDDIGRSRHAANSGAAFRKDADGAGDNALWFDGTDDFLAADSTLTGIRTIGFRMKRDAATGGIIDLDGGTKTVSISGDTVRVAGITSHDIYIDGVADSLVDASWRHVTVTSPTVLTLDAFTVGVADGAYFTGLIDDVVLYGRELSGAQADTLANAQIPPAFTYSDNLLANGGMELWSGGAPDGWSVAEDGGSTVTPDSVTVYAGTYSALATVDSQGSEAAISQTVSTDAGTRRQSPCILADGLGHHGVRRGSLGRLPDG